MAPAAPEPARGARHRRRAAGRPGLLGLRLLRRRDPHAGHRRGGGCGPALDRLHDRADVHAGPGSPAHRQEPARRGLRLAHARRPRLPGLPGGGDEPGRAHAARAAARARLRHLWRGQVAQRRRPPRHRGRRSVRLAAAARLRPLLRLLRRGDQLLLPGPPGRGQRVPAARRVPARLLQQRRLDRPGHPLPAWPPVRGPGQPAVPLRGAQRAARAAAGPPRGRRTLRRRLRRRLGRRARAALPAPDGPGRGAAALAAAGRLAGGSRLVGRARGRAPGHGALHAALRRDGREHRPQHRPPGGRAEGARPLGEHAARHHLGQRRLVHRRAAGLGQHLREAHHPARGPRPRAADVRARRTGRDGFVPGLPGGLGPGVQHALPLLQAHADERRHPGALRAELAGPRRRPGRAAAPLDPRHRPAAHRAGAAGRPLPGPVPGLAHAGPGRRVLRRAVARREPAERAHAAVHRARGQPRLHPRPLEDRLAATARHADRPRALDAVRPRDRPHRVRGSGRHTARSAA